MEELKFQSKDYERMKLEQLKGKDREKLLEKIRKEEEIF